MSSNEFNLARIEALEKKIKELELELENEKDKDNTEGNLGCNSTKCPCKQKEV